MVVMCVLCRLACALSSVIALSLLSCAVILPPSGGPEDRIPPRVEECTVPSGTLRVGRQFNVTITFSEYVERGDVGRALTVSPTTPYRLEWSGRMLTVSFDSLRPQTTYRMSIATGVRDLRGNRATEPFTLVFSTGDQLDSCQLTGQIISSSTAPLYAMLLAADSTYPMLEYRIPASSDGHFLVSALPCIPFIVAAFADANGSAAFEPGEQCGVAAAPVLAVPSSQERAVRIWLGSTSARSPLEIVSCRSLSDRRIRIECSAPLLHIGVHQWTVHEYPTGRSIPVIATLARQPHVVELISGEPLADTSSYYLSLQPGGIVADSTGARLPDTVTCIFKGNSNADLLPMSLQAIEPNRDTTRDAELRPTLHVRWSDALAGTPHIVLVELPSDATIPVVIERSDDASIRVQPRDSLRPSTMYQWRVYLGSIHSWRGEPSNDTGYLRRTIQTLDTRVGGSLRGVVEDICCTCPRRIVVIRSPQRSLVATVQADSSGQFTIPFLPEGTYELDAFCDTNGNGRHDSSSIQPLIYGERVAEKPITVSIKARWDTNGIILRLAQ
jgi:hypothetical protein